MEKNLTCFNEAEGTITHGKAKTYRAYKNARYWGVLTLCIECVKTYMSAGWRLVLTDDLVSQPKEE